MLRNPCPVICVFEYPSLRSAAFDRVVAHRSVSVSLARKHEPPVACQGQKLPEDFHGLGSERHLMMGPHFHASRRNTPFTPIKVEFRPFGHPQFSRPDKDEWRQA